MSIRKEIIFPVLPARVYELLLDGGKFAAATGQTAQVEEAEGGLFSVFGGKIHGRHIELIPGERIVQAWRGSDWDAGVYSIVRITLTREENGTKLVLDQEGYPEGKSPLFPTWHEHLSTGWRLFYLEPMASYLSNAAA